MKKTLVLFMVVVFCAIGMSACKSGATIVPTNQSTIEAVASESGKVILTVSGDLAGKFSWVEVYYKDPQEGGKYTLKFPLASDAVAIGTASVLGFNFGQGKGEYLQLDEAKGFPGKLTNLIQINGKEGEGAKLGLVP